VPRAAPDARHVPTFVPTFMAMLAGTALAEVLRSALQPALGFRAAAALSLAVFGAVSYYTRRLLLALRDG
jgi:hypothetical protein